MKRTEVSRDFHISESLLISFEASGLMQCRHDINGEPVYQEREVRLVNEIRSLLDTGMDREALRRYLSLKNEAKDTRPEQVRILRQHRAKLLDDLHGCQTALNRVDYIIYETEKGRKHS